LSEAEFQELYERYASLVYQRCRALLGNEAESQEATQEVFLRAFRHLPPSGAGPHRLAWLYTTAVNLSHDRARRNRHAALYLSEQPAEPTTDPRPPAEGRSSVRWVLAKLDAVTARMGILHFLDGFTQEEIGDQTGYSRKTVAKKLQHFRELLASTQRCED
jgi:RNA polymerase sigma-70 factor (ECF subfamily)